MCHKKCQPWHVPARYPFPMGDTFVTDLTHFVGADGLNPPPAAAARFVEHLTLIVRAATTSPPGVVIETALRCRRRPERRACPGFLDVRRGEVPPQIEWACTACADNGIITGWLGSPWNLAPPRPGDPPQGEPSLDVLLSEADYQALRSLRLLDTASERVVFRARRTRRGIAIAGTEDELEDLMGFVAAEANHESNRPRQRLLDAAFQRIEAALGRTSGSPASGHSAR